MSLIPSPYLESSATDAESEAKQKDSDVQTGMKHCGIGTKKEDLRWKHSDEEQWLDITANSTKWDSAVAEEQSLNLNNNH